MNNETQSKFSVRTGRLFNVRIADKKTNSVRDEVITANNDEEALVRLLNSYLPLSLLERDELTGRLLWSSWNGDKTIEISDNVI